MIKVIKKETYSVLGKEFDSIGSIATEIENRLGKIIDQTNVRLPPKQALELLDLIINNRDEIKCLLSIEVDVSSELLYSNLINVLDYR